MFSKPKQSQSNEPMPVPTKRSNNTSSSTFSVIGSDVIITGNVTAEVDLHIDGRVEGDVKCESLVQGESSEIHGAVTAQSARLSGLVKGSLDVRDLTIERSARITGDVSYENLSIEQGSHIDGQFKHKSNASSQPASKPNVKSAVNSPALDLTAEAAE